MKATVEHTMEVPPKIKNGNTMWSRDSTSGYLSEENRNTNVKRYHMYIMNIIQPQKRKKSGHLQQHGWTFRVFVLSEINQRNTNTVWSHLHMEFKKIVHKYREQTGDDQ